MFVLSTVFDCHFIYINLLNRLILDDVYNEEFNIMQVSAYEVRA